MDELQALERWGGLYSVYITVSRGRWGCVIREPLEGTASFSFDSWKDLQVVGEADHDPLLAIQSALIQAKAKWPKVKI
jgi:hypothetical protein